MTYPSRIPTDGLQDLLYWLDLNASVMVDTVISQSQLHASAVPWSRWQFLGGLFTDANLTTLYSFASDTEAQGSISEFKPNSGLWTNVSMGGGVTDSMSEGISVTTATSGLGLGFITGGYNNPEGTSASSGMIRFDASVPDALNWRNETEGAPILIRGVMEYARFGSKGIIIAVGGYHEVSSKTKAQHMIMWLILGQ